MPKIAKILEYMMIDLDVSNQKLYDRSCLIISEIGKVSEAEKLLHSVSVILHKIIC